MTLKQMQCMKQMRKGQKTDLDCACELDLTVDEVRLMFVRHNRKRRRLKKALEFLCCFDIQDLFDLF